jgi:hypothetical protein
MQVYEKHLPSYSSSMRVKVATVTDTKISNGKVGLRSQNGSSSYDNIVVE